eukprot:jgi/Astpho2/5376/Aster-05919
MCYGGGVSHIEVPEKALGGKVATAAIKAGAPKSQCNTYEDVERLLKAAAESVGCTKSALPRVSGSIGTVPKHVEGGVIPNPDYDEKDPCKGPADAACEQNWWLLMKFIEGHPPDFHRFRLLEPVRKCQPGPGNCAVAKLRQHHEEAFINLFEAHPPTGWLAGCVPAGAQVDIQAATSCHCPCESSEGTCEESGMSSEDSEETSEDSGTSSQYIGEISDREEECAKAAEAEDLQFLRSQAYQLCGSLHEAMSYHAALGGRLKVLQWLRQEGISFPPYLQMCHAAARGGNLAVLQRVLEQGCHWNVQTCAGAASGGHLALLQYAHQNGCAWDSSTCAAAAAGGHLAVLQYAHQNGCAWDSSAWATAAAAGHVAVLQYLHQNGCAWASSTCEYAASGGHLSILKWLRQHGCPWDFRTSRAAVIFNHLDLLKWARQQQPPCPWWGGLVYDTSVPKPSSCMLVYLLQQRAPLSARQLDEARAAATDMTSAFLLLRAALPDRTPHEVLLSIVSLAFS